MDNRGSTAIGYYRLARPILFALSPELAHGLAIASLRACRWLARARPDDSRLSLRLWGRHFTNPVGLAAGFDKDAFAFEGAMRLGFGFVEVGSVTPMAQPGNPRPRLFRLARDGAIINRMGFNSTGMASVAGRLASRRRGPGILGVNLGKNKESAVAADDYAAGARALAPFADYMVVNVSSPNTPGLRDLQNREAIGDISRRVRSVLQATGSGAALLLKISPDLASAELAGIAEVAMAGAFDGIIVGNTTASRPAGLDPALAGEAGGLSGRPLLELSTRVLREMYHLTRGRVPLVGVGGIADGRDAYAKIRAGASLVQLYTGLVYRGPGLVEEIKRELLLQMERDGCASLAEAVGKDHRVP